MTSILALDIAGNPFEWISPERAVIYQATGKVAWGIGDEVIVFRGGISRAGNRSVVRVQPIIALSGSEIMASMQNDVYRLGHGNEILFKRDRHLCAYCGQPFPRGQLTRDHIVPRAKGGRDTWTNVISACRRCNHEKGCRTPDEWGHQLLFVPYAPSRWEHFILSARAGILADQMEFLKAKLPSHSRAV